MGSVDMAHWMWHVHIGGHDDRPWGSARHVVFTSRKPVCQVWLRTPNSDSEGALTTGSQSLILTRA